jgi:hypothetical protein
MPDYGLITLQGEPANTAVQAFKDVIQNLAAQATTTA